MGLKEFRQKNDDGSRKTRKAEWNRPNKKQAKKLAQRQEAYDVIDSGKRKPQFPSVHETHKPGSMNPRKGGNAKG